MRKFNSCLAGICTALIIMFSAYDYLVPNTVPSTVTIYPESEKNERSNASEIWLTDILLNGKEQDLSQYLTNKNWSYHEENNDLFSGSAAESPDGILTLKFPPAKSITLVFSMHAWCGKIQLKEAEQIIEKDLYSEDSDTFEYQLQTNTTDRMQPASMLRSIAVFLALSILSTFCVIRYKKTLNKIRPYIFAFLYQHPDRRFGSLRNQRLHCRIPYSENHFRNLPAVPLAFPFLSGGTAPGRKQPDPGRNKIFYYLLDLSVHRHAVYMARELDLG